MPEASEPKPLAENVTVALLHNLIVMVPAPLTVAVVELEVEDDTLTLPLVSHLSKR